MSLVVVTTSAFSLMASVAVAVECRWQCWISLGSKVRTLPAPFMSLMTSPCLLGLWVTAPPSIGGWLGTRCRVRGVIRRSTEEHLPDRV
jgi:hypothetical protein